MDALELLKKWPAWEKANAATVLASPAWRMPVKFDGRDAALRMADAPVDGGVMPLRIRLEGEEHVLGIFDSAQFRDLHLMWSKRGALPDEVTLALVEKECGALLQTVEDAVRRQLSVVGVLHGAAPSQARTFLLEAGGAAMPFSLDLSPAMEIDFGRLDFLDTSHESIRSLTRPAEAEYAVVPLAEGDWASLGRGDFLLLPGDAVPKWTVERPGDGQLHVLGAESAELSFAEMADDALPPVPACGSFRLVRFGRCFAAGSPARVGDCAAVRIDEML